MAKQVSEAVPEKSFLIYPIIYLYRHYVELVLKAILTSAFELLDHKLTDDEERTLLRHDLCELWQAARALLDRVCECASTPSLSIVELEWVGSYILQIHECDPDGQRFRYVTTKAKRANQSGSVALSLSPDLKLGNVDLLAMEKLADYLEGIEGWCVELEDAKVEWRRMYGCSDQTS